MKTLDDIWDEYLEQDCLSKSSIKDLAWHIENDANPASAISMTADMGLKELGSVIAKQLNNPDDWIRELSIGCLLGRLELPEYAAIGFKMAKEDPDDSVQDLALFNIGYVVNKITDRDLQRAIIEYLYRIMVEPDPVDAIDTFKRAAYHSILTAMEIPLEEQPSVMDLEKSIDPVLIAKFKEKYGIK